MLSFENDDLTLLFPLSLHTWQSRVAVGWMWGESQLGTSMTIQGKGKSVWTHLMLSGFQTTAEWVFCVCCRCWPCPFSGSSAGICCWHLELMNTKRNSSLLNQQLSAYSALAVGQTLTLLPSGSWVLSLRSPKAGSCHMGTQRSLGDDLCLPMALFSIP